MATAATSDDRLVAVTFDSVPAPNPAGLTFAGTFQAAAGGEANHLFTPAGYPDLPRFVEHAQPLDDHTGRMLRRQTFYLFRRDDNREWVQVAEQWLADYVDDAVAASLLIWWVNQSKKLMLTIRDSMPIQGREHFTVQEVIETAIKVIEVRGWVSRGHSHKFGGTATASFVQDLLAYEGVEVTEPTQSSLDRLREEINARPNRDDSLVQSRANGIIDWLTALHADQEGDHKVTDYLHNLALAANQEYVEARHIGLLCSAPAAHQEWLRIQEEIKRNPPVEPGRHYGTLDERVEADIHVDEIENRGENEYGVSLLVHMHVVPTGERLKWWTGEGLKLDVDKDYHVRMTIKKHGEWDGRRETTVSRVMEFEPPPPKEKKPRKGSKP